jgi:hypothetical protein
MKLLKEIKINIEGIRHLTPQIHCRVFQDNSEAAEISKRVKSPIVQPRTKISMCAIITLGKRY